MKWKSKKLLTAIAVGLGSFFISTVCITTTSYAHVVDSSSVVFQGVNNRGICYAAVNVVDDDGTVYTFYYQYKPGTDYSYYRISGDSTWHEWPLGIGVKYTHIELLAMDGLKVVSNKTVR